MVRSSHCFESPVVPDNMLITMPVVEIVNWAIEEYLEKIGAHGDAVLEKMENRAEELTFPIVGPLVGRILFQLARLVSAKRIIELGSGFGYSAYWLARGMTANGEIILTDFKRENLDLARSYFEQGRTDVRSSFLEGDALEVLNSLKGEFDIIFNDVEKDQYPDVFREAGRRLRSGGLLISDNVLWHGHVLEEEPDDDTRGIVEYNRLIFESPQFFSSIIPVRDGLSVSLKA